MNKDLLNLKSDLDNFTKKTDDSDQYVGDEEFKSMKKNKYEKNKNLTTSYVIQHKKTKKIVEVKAISPILAAETVGWRPRHVTVLRVNE